MKASLFKRIVAYVIDVTILSVIISIIASIFFSSSNIEILKDELSVIFNEYAEGKISIITYINKVSDINYDIDYETIGYTIIQFIIYVLYFIIYQFKNNGQTLGKKIMKIRIISCNDNDTDYNSLTTDSLVKRSLIVNELFVIMFSLTAILTVNRRYYYSLIIFINIIQSLIIFISCFMILYRKDGKTIHDILANTQVVIDKGEK
jgi:uncharacterized RDD family membrane protein YckC